MSTTVFTRIFASELEYGQVFDRLGVYWVTLKVIIDKNTVKVRAKPIDSQLVQELLFYKETTVIVKYEVINDDFYSE
jgi:hypothetical protein